ncbi:MAG: tartrate dehydrogenase [Chloroflexota bacterium]
MPQTPTDGRHALTERNVTTQYDIAVIAGDGIGQEVTPAAIRCLDRSAELAGFSISWTDYPWGSARFKTEGRMMPTDGIDILSGHDAILLGAVGDPEIPDVETLWGLLIPIRRSFDQYINLRPIRTLPGVEPPVPAAAGMDLVVVRENVEGEYSEVGGRIFHGQEREIALQEAVFTRFGIRRVARFAAELADSRKRSLVSATKSNGIVHTMPFWDEVVHEVTADFPYLDVRNMLIDALAARLVLSPLDFDVIVASNLFGDILSDLTAAIAGSIGVAPSGNINPERAHPSLFEPVHGSAPDIAGKGIANPIGMIWAGAMMLEHLGEAAAGNAIIDAFENTLAANIATPDLQGEATTDTFTDEVVSRIRV